MFGHEKGNLSGREAPDQNQACFFDPGIVVKESTNAHVLKLFAAPVAGNGALPPKLALFYMLKGLMAVHILKARAGWFPRKSMPNSCFAA